MTCSLADLRYSAALIPHTLCVNGLPKPRLPSGGKRLSKTTSFAFAASETCKTGAARVSHHHSGYLSRCLGTHTIGTRTPLAPASSAYLICHEVPVLVPVAGMRTSALGALLPIPVIAWMDSAAPGWSEVSPCSQSIMTHERYGLDRATVLALITPGKVIHAPKAGLAALNACARA